MRSWNCPWMSPQTMTGARTGTTFGSYVKIYLACIRSPLLFRIEPLLMTQAVACKSKSQQFVYQGSNDPLHSSFNN